MNGNFVNFRAVYDELTDEVMRARYQFIPDHLQNWLQCLDETPEVSEIISRLQSNLDFETWLKSVQQTQGQWAGGATLNWPGEPDKRLGLRLLLFRAFARSKPDIAQFGFIFMPSGRNINDNARAVIDQIFGPTARELRRYLERVLLNAPAASTAPASDRVVRIDHNSAEYSAVMESLDKVSDTIVGANDYPDPEDKDQRLAEIGAATRLLKSVRVRIGALVALITPTLTYLTQHFIGTAVGDAAQAAMNALEVLFKMIF